MCIDASTDNKKDKTVKMYPCHGQGGNQVSALSLSVSHEYYDTR